MTLQHLGGVCSRINGPYPSLSYSLSRHITDPVHHEGDTSLSNLGSLFFLGKPTEKGEGGKEFSTIFKNKSIKGNR